MGEFSFSQLPSGLVSQRTFLFSSDTSTSEGLHVAAFSCPHSLEGHLDWLFASSSLLLSVSLSQQQNTHNKNVCLGFRDESSVPATASLLVDNQPITTHISICKPVHSQTGRVSFLLETNSKPFDNQHFYLKYTVQK